VKLTRASRQPVPMRHHRQALLGLSHEIACRVAERRNASRITAFGVGLLKRICRENVWISRIGNRRAVLRRVEICRQWVAMDTEREKERGQS
jgi:hypothetical protein